MRIARLGNFYQPVPAQEYGGTQRSMAQITAFQAAVCGHDITLYASADSEIISFTKKVCEDLGLACKIDSTGNAIAITNTGGHTGYVRLKSCGFNSIGYDDPEEAQKHATVIAEFIKDEQTEPYDIIHCHYRACMRKIFENNLSHKTLVHQHTGQLEKNYPSHRYNIICISHSQAAILKRKSNALVHDVIYHGLDAGAYLPTTEHASYLAWIGRFLEEKGAHRAIRIAQAANTPLVLAGMIYDKKPESEQHFLRDVAPYLTVTDHTFLNRIAGLPTDAVRNEIKKIGEIYGVENPIIFCGPANELQKQTLYGNAQATLFPISWAEPFGRVMIESMACGTPVIGNIQLGNINCGSVREVIANGSTGFTIDAENEADAIALSVEAVNASKVVDRKEVRRVFLRDWTSERTAKAIDASYQRLVSEPNKLGNEPTAQF